MSDPIPGRPAHAGRPSPDGPPRVDLQALAERLVQLLRAELRVERERLGPDRRPQGGR